MDIKLKNINNKKFSYIIYTLIFIFSAVSFLSILEVKDNFKFVGNKNIYVNTELKYQIDEFTSKSIDFVIYYKDEEYAKDKANITQNDIDICKAEIKGKIETEYASFREGQYSYNSFNELDYEGQQKVLEEEKKKIEEKYTPSDEAFQEYVIERKVKSYNSLKNELDSYVNIKFTAYDKVNNTWIGESGNNILELQKDSSYFVERNLDRNSFVNDNLYINGKEIKDPSKRQEILSYSYSSNNNYGNSYNNNYNLRNNSEKISVYIWIPKVLKAGDNIYTSYEGIKSNINRLLFSAIIFLVSSIITVMLINVNRKKSSSMKLTESLINKLKKYSVEYKLGVVLIAIAAWKFSYYGLYYNNGYTRWLNFSYLIGTSLVILIIYLIVIVLINDYNEGNLFSNNITKKILESFNNITRSGSIFRTILIYFLGYGTIGFGLLFIALISGGVLFPICLLFGIVMTIGLVSLSVKNLYYLDRIMVGAKDGAEGRLTYRIEEKGRGKFRDLASNINNIKEGLRESINKEVKSEKMKTELITNVSHDLKTPLTSIINYIDLLKRENIEPEEARDYVRILDAKSQRLKSLIEDLFEASKVASGALELNVEKIEITQLLKQALGENDEKLTACSLDVRTNIPDEKIFINGDGKRLYRVFENLITNISKYSLMNTRVYIDVIKNQNEVKIVMRNISSYELNFNAHEITERFKRGDEARTSEGSGLGLAIAKSIIELHNGEFKVEVDGDLFKSIISLKM